MAKRRPTHNLKVFNPDREDDPGKFIGAGWEHPETGAILIALDPGIILSTVGVRCVLFKRKSEDERRGERRKPSDDYA